MNYTPPAGEFILAQTTVAKQATRQNTLNQVIFTQPHLKQSE